MASTPRTNVPTGVKLPSLQCDNLVINENLFSDADITVGSDKRILFNTSSLAFTNDGVNCSGTGLDLDTWRWDMPLTSGNVIGWAAFKLSNKKVYIPLYSSAKA